MIPERLVLDAGPLIALLHRSDPDHEEAVRGFRRLAEGGARLFLPMPVLFEVFKWLLFQAGPKAAREGLPKGVFLGWKNFKDEDFPMLTVAQTMAQVKPTPNFVSYQ